MIRAVLMLWRWPLWLLAATWCVLWRHKWDACAHYASSLPTHRFHLRACSRCGRKGWVEAFSNAEIPPFHSEYMETFDKDLMP